jgi:hypothetical protein
VNTVELDETLPHSGHDVREIAFELNGQRCAFTVKAAGDETIPSVFLLGLPKAGSTLLNRLMKPVTHAAGLTFVAVQEVMRDIGVPPRDIPPEANQVFRPAGYAFGGFRSLPGALALPPYAANRTVLLVRDPRDMLTSLYFSLAHSHGPPGQGAGGALAATFEEKRQEVNGMDIDAFVLGGARVVAGQYRAVERKLLNIPHRLYRYEDIIFDKLAWANDMLAYLGLSVSAAVVDQAVKANDVRPEVEDVAQHVRKVVPGDHAEKLKAETVAELNTQLAPVLQKYRYA